MFGNDLTRVRLPALGAHSSDCLPSSHDLVDCYYQVEYSSCSVPARQSEFYLLPTPRTSLLFGASHVHLLPFIVIYAINQALPLELDSQAIIIVEYGHISMDDQQIDVLDNCNHHVAARHIFADHLVFV